MTPKPPEENTQTMSAYLLNMGWVLPDSVGAGRHLPDQDPTPQPPGNRLESFSAKPYLKSVKGYLDPAEAYALSAVALALGDQRDSLAQHGQRAGIASATCFGAATSAQRFFDQMLDKGHRLASPVVFPHSYASSAPNLAAIEFGLGGPHMVFYAPAAAREAWEFALAELKRGEADDMIVLACEAPGPSAIPTPPDTMPGAFAVWLTTRSGTPGALALNPNQVRNPPHPAAHRGTVHEILAFLRALLT